MSNRIDVRLMRQEYSGEFAVRLSQLLLSVESALVGPLLEEEVLALMAILTNRELHLRDGNKWNAGDPAYTLGVGDAAAVVASMNGGEGRDAEWWRMHFVYGDRGSDRLWELQGTLVARLLKTGLFTYIEP